VAISFTVERRSRSILRQSDALSTDAELSRDSRSGGDSRLNLLRIGVGFSGEIPIHLEALMINCDVTEVV
jgi:hypothetical protein